MTILIICYLKQTGRTIKFICNQYRYILEFFFFFSLANYYNTLGMTLYINNINKMSLVILNYDQ